MRLNLFLISFGIFVLLFSGLSSALVVENLVGMPANEIPHNSVGAYPAEVSSPSTAEVITPNHIITARHIDGGSTTPRQFRINGVTYNTYKVYNSDQSIDLKIIEISPEEIALKGPLPKPYLLTSPQSPAPSSGDLVYIAGHGQYALSKISSTAFSVSTSSSSYPRWGMNRLGTSSSTYLTTSFTGSSSSTSVPLYESQASVYDSGSGIYSADSSSGNTLLLLGVVHSASTGGTAIYGYSTYFINLRNPSYNAWINDVFENQSALGVKPVFYTSSGLENAKKGDVTFNGGVDIQDFSSLASHFGEDITDAVEELGTVKYPKLEMWNRGDFNGDEKVNIHDWNIFLANYGK